MKSLYLIIQHTGVRGHSFRRFIYPSPALACVVSLRVLRENGVEALPAPYQARWTGSQQPPELGLPNVGIPPSVFEMLSKRDVFPHTREKIDVCIKYEGEDACYIFNNASYAVSDYRVAAHRLTAGIYIVEATATSGDIVVQRSFRLRNDFQRQDFRLEAISNANEAHRINLESTRR
jgi:hypothetical protein